MNWKKSLKGKLYLVTGATSGNGEAVSHELLRLGARVIGIGRNESKLAELRMHAGAWSYQVDFGSTASIDAFTARLAYHRVKLDGIIHLAGNALIHDASAEVISRFEQTDYHGPISMIESLFPLLVSDAKVAVVTSGSVVCHGRHYRSLEHYARVKHMMVEWCQNQQGVTSHRTCLIFMGIIYSGIWARTVEIPHRVDRLMRLTMPRPQRCASVIIRDVALGRSVSCPGRFARTLWTARRLGLDRVTGSFIGSSADLLL